MVNIAAVIAVCQLKGNINVLGKDTSVDKQLLLPADPKI